MICPTESLAFQLYWRFRGGQTCEQLASELGIPLERIRLRIQAAAACWQRRTQAEPAIESSAGLTALSQKVGQAG